MSVIHSEPGPILMVNEHRIPTLLKISQVRRQRSKGVQLDGSPSPRHDWPEGEHEYEVYLSSRAVSPVSRVESYPTLEAARAGSREFLACYVAEHSVG